jgi:hypothetical protein
MTTPDIAGLCERLRAVESSGHSGVTTNWHRNPDGPEAADTLERQAAENKRLRGAAQAVIDRWETPHWKDVPATAVFIGNLRAAITGEDAATLGLSGKTQTDARTRGDA